MIHFQTVRSTRGGGAGCGRPRRRGSREQSRWLPILTFVLFPAPECFNKERGGTEEVGCRNGEEEEWKYNKNGDEVKRERKIKDGTLEYYPKTFHMPSSISLTNINELVIWPTIPKDSTVSLGLCWKNKQQLHLHLYLYVCVFECLWVLSPVYFMLLWEHLFNCVSCKKAKLAKDCPCLCKTSSNKDSDSQIASWSYDQALSHSTEKKYKDKHVSKEELQEIEVKGRVKR